MQTKLRSTGKRGRPAKYCLTCKPAIYRNIKRLSDRKYQARKRANNPGYKSREFRSYRAKYPHKYKAQTVLNNAIKTGRIKRLPCQKCGNSRVHAHHPNYKYPLNVIWLCPVHHKEIHQERNQMGYYSNACIHDICYRCTDQLCQHNCHDIEIELKGIINID